MLERDAPLGRVFRAFAADLCTVTNTHLLVLHLSSVGGKQQFKKGNGNRGKLEIVVTSAHRQWLQ